MSFPKRHSGFSNGKGAAGIPFGERTVKRDDEGNVSHIKKGNKFVKKPTDAYDFDWSKKPLDPKAIAYKKKMRWKD